MDRRSKFPFLIACPGFHGSTYGIKYICPRSYAGGFAGFLMLELETVLLIFGFVFLLLLATRRVTRKQKTPPAVSGRPAQSPALDARSRMTAEQFNRSWKSLSYLLLLAAAGNLYMLYRSVTGALETGSYILWIDAVFSLAAAVIAILIWKLHQRSLVLAYFVVMVIPIMFFISTRHPLDGLIRLFPVVLVYFVVSPVWDVMDEQPQSIPHDARKRRQT
jgi:hypothetical protein